MKKLNDGIPRNSHGIRLVWITCETCGKRVLMPVDGRLRFCSIRCAKTREHHHAWKGEQAGYVSKHGRVYRVRGKADHCERCGRTDPGTCYEWANLTGNYGDVNDYKPMCKSCHVAYDGQVGSGHGMAKLTEELVAQIRERAGRGESQRHLAAEFGVAQRTIWSLIHRKTWKNVP